MILCSGRKPVFRFWCYFTIYSCQGYLHILCVANFKFNLGKMGSRVWCKGKLLVKIYFLNARDAGGITFFQKGKVCLSYAATIKIVGFYSLIASFLNFQLYKFGQIWDFDLRKRPYKKLNSPIEDSWSRFCEGTQTTWINPHTINIHSFICSLVFLISKTALPLFISKKTCLQSPCF